MRIAINGLFIASIIPSILGNESKALQGHVSTNVERKLTIFDGFDADDCGLSTSDFNDAVSFYGAVFTDPSDPVCYVENNDFDEGPRAVPVYAGRGDCFNTADSCAVQCLVMGYAISAVGEHETCFCTDESGYTVNKVLITYDEYGIDSSCDCSSLADLGDGQICVTVLESNYEYLGCFKDDIPRALPVVAGYDYTKRVDPIAPNKGNSFLECGLECFSAGFQFMGLQYGRECWCGSGYTYKFYGEAKGCDCDGLNIGYFKQCVYKVPDSVFQQELEILYLGCFNDVGNRGSVTNTGRALPHLQDGEYGSIDECFLQCQNEYYDLFGLQHNMECWCGSSSDDDPYRYGFANTCKCDSVTSIGSNVFCMFAIVNPNPIPDPSASPSAKPTGSPSDSPTLTSSPSLEPSLSTEPTTSYIPTLTPSLSSEPSLSTEPSLSKEPTS